VNNNKNTGFDRVAIKKKLKIKNYNFSIIAEACNCSTSIVSSVAARKGRSKKVATAICIAMGEKIENVFPDVSSYFDNKNTKEFHINKVNILKEAMSNQENNGLDNKICIQNTTKNINHSWFAIDNAYHDFFTPIYIRIILPDGVHVVAPLQKKLNSNLYELLVPSQLFVLKCPKGAISND